MPLAKKKQAAADSDTSDSGPEDREPVAKKSKPEKKKSSHDDDEEPTWVLDKRRLLKVREFKGKLMVDIREYYDADGELKPGKKGISLSIPQWKKLVDCMSEVEDAIKEKA